jgi:hypothetical protein
MEANMTRGLMVSVALRCSLAASVGAQDRAPSDGSGWVFGGGLTGGIMGFAGADGRAVAVGPVTRVVVISLDGTSVGQRRLQLVDPSQPPPPGTVLVATFPASSSAGGLTLHGGYAFSPRIALLADAEVMSSWGNGFNNAIFAAVIRYRPARRVWVEAGPARGDLGYGYQDTGSVYNSITGSGFLAAAGVSVLAKPKWTVDLQARYGSVWYDGIRARNLSFGLSVGRVRSGDPGKPSTPAARAAARRGGASRG